MWDQADKLVYYFFFPVLLFRSVSKGELDLPSAGSFMLAGWLFALSSIALVYLLPRLPWFRSMDKRAYAATAQVGFRFNAFLGLAVAYAQEDSQVLFFMSLLIGTCVPIFNLAAVWPMARGSQLPLHHELAKNPLILSTLAGIAAALLGVEVPTMVGNLLDRLGVIAITLGLLAVGAGMRFRAIGNHKRLSVVLLMGKHLVAPLLALVLVIAFALTAAQALTLLLFAALPTATSCYVLAKNMGYEGSYVASLVTFSTLLGALSLSLALQLAVFFP